MLSPHVAAEVAGRLERFKANLTTQIQRGPMMHFLQMLHPLPERRERFITYTAHVRPFLMMVAFMAPQPASRRANFAANIAIHSRIQHVYLCMCFQTFREEETLPTYIADIIRTMLIHMLR